MDTDYAMKARHYKPASQGAVCDAGRIVCAAEQSGALPKFSILRMMTTTDIRKVSCVHCRKWIAEVAAKMMG